MPGPARLPTKLKLVKGSINVTRERERHPGGAEPEPEVGIPECPPDISLRAKEAWPVFAQITLDLGTLTKADGFALAALCETYAELCEARKQLRMGGPEFTYISEGEKGNKMLRARPEMGLIQDADRRYMQWLARFGLTPADRSRVSAKTPTKKNEFSDL